MNVLLLHLDGAMSNLALMRIAAHHRALGDVVELRHAFKPRALDQGRWRTTKARTAARVAAAVSRRRQRRR